MALSRPEYNFLVFAPKRYTVLPDLRKGHPLFIDYKPKMLPHGTNNS